MNKEFIDKHEAYLLLKQKAETYMLPATKEAYEKAAILIGSLPTIEAEPVKHGRWKERHYMEMKWIPSRFDNVSPEDVDIEPMVELKCSKCHLWSVNFRNHTELKYCPMCGARMDGDSE